MNANMGFELFSGVSAVFTMDLPTNWLVLLLESICADRFGSSTCNRHNFLG